jgi:uncharacterized membrane protein
MTKNPILYALILSLLPISELRGGIPFAVANDISLLTAYILCVASNILVIPIVYLFLETLHKQFYKVNFYKVLFDKWVERTRKKAEKNVARYGYWGVMLFVAIPLPVTGAYTGTLAAWILQLDRKKSFWYLVGGVLIAGIIVSIATVSGIKAFEIFMKK